MSKANRFRLTAKPEGTTCAPPQSAAAPPQRAAVTVLDVCVLYTARPLRRKGAENRRWAGEEWLGAQWLGEHGAGTEVNTVLPPR